MKRAIITYIFISSCVFVLGKTSYLQGVRVLSTSIEKQNDKNVRVKMNLDFSELGLKKQHSLTIVPVLVSGDGSEEQVLPSVVLNGKIRNKVNARLESLTDTRLYPEGTTVLRRKNGSEQSIQYDASVPFCRWMIGGELQLRSYTVGCASCSKGDEMMALGNALPPMEVNYLAGVMVPEDESVKRRSETINAHIQFLQNSSFIIPGYADNRTELDSIFDALSNLKEDHNVALSGVSVKGYASPEGGFEFNQQLSEKRVKSFTEYIRSHQKGELNIHTEGKGEDWDGLRKYLDGCLGADYSKQVLSLIDGCDGDWDLCEQKIKELLPAEMYARLFDEVYPKLRRNEVYLEYKVRHFEVSEGKEIIFKEPAMLSVSEIHKVAESYGKGTDEYLSAMLAGVKGHPEDVVMVNNAALALMAANRPQEAVALLESSPEDSRLINVMGCAYLDMDKTDEALKCFKKSASMGFKDAQTNLTMLEKYLEYIAE